MLVKSISPSAILNLRQNLLPINRQLSLTELVTDAVSKPANLKAPVQQWEKHVEIVESQTTFALSVAQNLHQALQNLQFTNLHYCSLTQFRHTI